MNLIVAVDRKWGIGKKNDLLFHLPEDLAYFKQKTLNKTIVMGGNTLLSFPRSKPLPNRTNLVLSDVFTRDDCEVFPTLQALKERLKQCDTDDVYVVGGAMFYATMLPYCDTAYITKVDADGEATHFFPDLDKAEGWEEVETVGQTVSNGYNIAFTVYRNRNPKSL